MLLRVFLLLFLFSHTAAAFDLFDPDRGKPKVAPKPPAPIKAPSNPFANVVKPKPDKPKKLKPQQNFTLRGTLQLGDKHIAFLQDPRGKEIDPLRLIGTSGSLPIPDHPGYALLEVKPRQIKLAYPDDAPCRVSSVKTGVTCVDNGKAAELTLLRHEPLKAPPKPASVPTKTQTPPTNPFAPRAMTPEEAKKREADVAKRRELYKNFKKRVIRDEDVPPGMRVVRTPFGDRLVPDNK